VRRDNDQNPNACKESEAIRSFWAVQVCALHKLKELVTVVTGGTQGFLKPTKAQREEVESSGLTE
jgi:hypothetical protein